MAELGKFADLSNVMETDVKDIISILKNIKDLVTEEFVDVPLDNKNQQYTLSESLESSLSNLQKSINEMNEKYLKDSFGEQINNVFIPSPQKTAEIIEKTREKFSKPKRNATIALIDVREKVSALHQEKNTLLFKNNVTMGKINEIDERVSSILNKLNDDLLIKMQQKRNMFDDFTAAQTHLHEEIQNLKIMESEGKEAAVVLAAEKKILEKTIEELKNKLSDLNNKSADSEEEKKLLREEIEKLKESLKSLENSLLTLKNSNQMDLEKQKEAERLLIEEHEQDLNEIEKLFIANNKLTEEQISKLHNQIRQISERVIIEQERSYNTSQEMRDQCDKEKKQLEEEIAQQQQKYQTLFEKQLQLKNEELKKTSEIISAEEKEKFKIKLEQEKTRNNIALEDCQRKINELNSQIVEITSKYETQLKKLEEEKKNLDVELTSVRKEIAEQNNNAANDLEKKRQQLQNQYQEEVQKNEQLETEARNLRLKISEAEGKLLAKEQLNELLKEQIDKNRSYQSKKIKQITDLSRDLKSRLNEKEKEVETSKNNISALDSQIANLNKEIKKLKASNDDLSKQLVKEKNIITQLKLNQSELGEELLIARDSIIQYMREIEQLRSIDKKIDQGERAIIQLKNEIQNEKIQLAEENNVLSQSIDIIKQFVIHREVTEDNSAHIREILKNTKNEKLSDLLREAERSMKKMNTMAPITNALQNVKDKMFNKEMLIKLKTIASVALIGIILVAFYFIVYGKQKQLSELQNLTNVESTELSATSSIAFEASFPIEETMKSLSFFGLLIEQFGLLYRKSQIPAAFDGLHKVFNKYSEKTPGDSIQSIVTSDKIETDYIQTFVSNINKQINKLSVINKMFSGAEIDDVNKNINKEIDNFCQENFDITTLTDTVYKVFKIAKVGSKDEQAKMIEELTTHPYNAEILDLIEKINKLRPC